MSDMPDAELLKQFARNRSEDAFSELVQRHIGLVHSVALRHTANPEQAQDITQAVFIILARKAGSLGPRVILPGWLYHTARLTAANIQRADMRRIRREQEVFMQSNLEEPASEALWRELSPLLDDAMGKLGATDRDAIVLRFFQNRSLADVGTAMGIAERAAQKRVNRALEKLRKFFMRRGVSSTSATMAQTISTHSMQTVPAALAKSVMVVAIAKGVVASTSTLALVEATMRVMTWMKVKFAVAVGAGAVAVVVVSTAIVVHSNTPAAQPPMRIAAETAPALNAGNITPASRLPEPMMLDISNLYRESPPHVEPPGILTNFLGMHFYDGLPFQIGGQAQLRGQKIGGVQELDGVHVGRTFDELDLIHHARWGDVDGKQIATVRLNYADGTTYEFPICYGVQLRDWYRMQGEEDETISDPNSKVIWRHPPVQYDASIRIFKSKLANPYPEKVVDTIDFISADSVAGYDLLAATVADKDPGRAQTPPVPSDEPKRHFDGSVTIRVVDRTTKKPISGALINPVIRISGATSMAPPKVTDKKGVAVLHYPTGDTMRIKLIADAPGYTEANIIWIETFPKDYTFRLLPIGQKN